jgi:hypothetical protein
MCNDIGEASYIDSLVASALLGTVRRLPGAKGYTRKISDRYNLRLEGAPRPLCRLHCWPLCWLCCSTCGLSALLCGAPCPECPRCPASAPPLPACSPYRS